MESIRPLSEAVNRAVHSSFIISDLTTVVQELVYNSLDAQATKVSVYLGVSNGYVRVDDDGCGISRDGLVLLGECYATSKLHHLPDKDDVKTFGFRGEVLFSIADTSLIEITTKVQGRPNGYRKVMKGHKCLYFSIDDRQDVGTTVIVRDLFYNQPVRQRQMQSNAKKGLLSAKKCVVQIALVQPRVSFKVVDIESEDELLRTHSSALPLSVLCSSFGFEASSLHELTFSQGSLKLEGYVSGPSSSSSSKAIQYIYVNSRFIAKGRIHKALNRLADLCWEQLSSDKGGKGGHTHIDPIYCLNLSCPNSFCDLSLEFSRTSVQFKDWARVLTFIKKAVMTVWSKKANNGDCYNCEAGQTETAGVEKLVKVRTAEKDWLLKTCQIPTKRCKILNVQNNTLNPVEMLVEDGSPSFCEDMDIGGRNLPRNFANFEEAEVDGEFPYQMDSSESRCASPLNYIFDAGRNVGNCWLESVEELKSSNEDLLEDTVQRDGYGHFLARSRREDELRVDDAYARNSEAGKRWDCEFGMPNDLLQALSSEVPTSLKYNKSPMFRVKNNEANRSCGNFIGEADACLSPKLSDFRRLQSQHGVSRNRSLSKVCLESDIWEDPGVTSMKCRDSLSSNGLFERGHTAGYLSEQVTVFNPCFSPDSDHYSTLSHPFRSAKPLDPEHFIQDGLERSKVKNFDAFQSHTDKEEFYHDDHCENCFHENPFQCHLNSNLIFMNEYTGAENDALEFSNLEQCVTSTSRDDDVLYEDPQSTCMDRRERNCRYTPSICLSPSKSDNREAQIDEWSREAVHAHHISRRLRGDDHEYNLDLFLSSAVRLLGEGPKADLSRCEALERSCRHSRQMERSSIRTKKSCSAPPIYRAKRRFFSISKYLICKAERPEVQIAPPVCNVTERGELEHTHSSLLFNSQYHELHEMNHSNDSSFLSDSREMGKETPNITQICNISQENRTVASCGSPGDLKRFRDTETLLTKYREGLLDGRLLVWTQGREWSKELKDENAILDVDSSILQVGDSLVPKSINRRSLENAKVLLQIDKKFIPVVAGGTLAVIDQHAADERIRLEEMHKKVLSGELKSITSLEEEKDLVLPEIACQLLCNYTELVQNWGWLCNIFCQDSGSFNKDLNLLSGQPIRVSLLAVPCILGINLSDVDLMEFLEQLADTDGSSTIPPAILRILSYKACRGAVMFGDKLLPSECNLIVEELKQTSLCFQCAHGRPTTAPLVNLEALHKSIAQTRSGRDGCKFFWHGLRCRRVSLEHGNRRINVSTSHG